MRLNFLAGRLLGTATLLAFSTAALADEEDYPNALVEAASEGADVTILKPISPWNIDFGASRCRLTRIFGAPDDQHLLFFEQAAPRAQFGVTFAGSQLSRFQSGRQVYVGMERDEPMDEIERVGLGNVDGVGPAVILSSFTINPGVEIGGDEEGPQKAGINLERAATIDRIVLQQRDRVLSFETGSMMPPFQALNTCTGDLLREWGLDQAAHENYTPPKWTNQQRIVDRIVRSYPAGALFAGEQGIFRMRVIVEADGSVSECHLEKSTETERLESPACKEMRRAEFDPALDAQGQPMRSFYATTITYAIN